MKDLSRSCIFDGSTDNLNTIMEVVLDDEKYKVAVCNECEDEASPSAIKKLIPKKLEELEQEKAAMRAKMEMFRELADEMGFALVRKDDLQQIQKPAPRAPGDPNALSDKPTVKVGGATFKMQKDTRKNQNNDEAGLSREEAVAALEAAKREAGRTGPYETPPSGSAPSFPKHQIPDTVTINTGQGPKTYEKPTIGAKTMQTVRGAGGAPTVIPNNIHGTDGETTITIVDTGGDRTIQMRGRQLGQMRHQGDRSDYSHACRPCQGTGLHAKRMCKACGGVGIII